MKNATRLLFVLAFIVSFLVPAAADPIYSPSWGFRMDIPEGYEFTSGDGKTKFAFDSQFGTFLELDVFTDKASLEALADETVKKLGAQDSRKSFTYHGKKALYSEINYTDPQKKGGKMTACVLYIELNPPVENAPAKAGRTPLLRAWAYGPANDSLKNIHLSALDSLSVDEADRLLSGPLMELNYPIGAWKRYTLANTGGLSAWFHEGDAEASQALVNREFDVLKRYLKSERWQEAWKRFYRAIHRDSYDRLKDASFTLERYWATEGFGNDPVNPSETEGIPLGSRPEEARAFAQKALTWVQNFTYERDLLGSDFINLVTAVQEGRGDCDTRSMLWAIILEQTNIEAAIMVSREYSHAMGLADLEGEGARFPFKEGGADYRWMVAETTAHVDIGRIGEKSSEISKWLGIVF